ncbi:MAG: metal ABC transporter solute-binding protein, Zn/Mn family, partial [Acetobacteraceae bacterium]
MPGLVFALTLSVLALAPWLAWAKPVRIVAAENFYGEVAAAIGGPHVSVQSILKNPEQDPHLFEITPAALREIAAARVVVYNGIGYDPWMAAALRATSSSARRILVVARLVGKRAGDNPHIWYDPDTMLVLARTLSRTLARLDPAHASRYDARLGDFVAAMRPVQAKIAAMRARFAATEVAATEPVFNAMFRALGMHVLDLPFQRAVMN